MNIVNHKYSSTDTYTADSFCNYTVKAKAIIDKLLEEMPPDNLARLFRDVKSFGGKIGRVMQEYGLSADIGGSARSYTLDWHVSKKEGFSSSWQRVAITYIGSDGAISTKPNAMWNELVCRPAALSFGQTTELEQLEIALSTYEVKQFDPFDL